MSRYEFEIVNNWGGHLDNEILDTETNETIFVDKDVLDLLNQQDEQIKKLESENRKLFDLNVELCEENGKQKFNQTKLAIKELEKVKEEWFTENGFVIIGKGSIPQNGSEETLCKYLDQRIKELRGEKK